ncbi:MAG: hypothetical protein EA394_04900 [Bacteroidia bacterium]|nr:MAG: hypothetical protein EA394_04900 [Bacteroidia bacterium]
MYTIEQSLKTKSGQSNSMVETIANHFPGIRKQMIKESLGGFPNLEHRLEEVATIRGIRFINDSRATNVNASWFALEIMHYPIIWIAGGKDRDNDYTMLYRLIKQKVKAIICIGADNSNMIRSFQHLGIPLTEFRDMEEAVKMAYEIGEPGDIVLLSPASASFDYYDNYEQRGDVFKHAVYGL